MVKQWPFIHTLGGTQNKRDRVKEAAGWLEGKRIFKLHMSKSFADDFDFAQKSGAKYICVRLAAGGDGTDSGALWFSHTHFEQEEFSEISCKFTHSLTLISFDSR